MFEDELNALRENFKEQLEGLDDLRNDIIILCKQNENLRKLNSELTDKNIKNMIKIEKMKADLIENFGTDFNILVTKLLIKWENE